MVTVTVTFSARTQIWCLVIVVTLGLVMEVAALNGPNVCMVKQKYNITKRVKYRAPMSVRTYEWCMSLPPRCSRWTTEMRDLTRLETEERTAEVAVCCPGYKMRDVSCVPICPNGRTGHGCSEECPDSKWGPNCVNDCPPCSEHGTCSPITGECSCQEGWQGESCESRLSSTTSTTTTTVTARVEELLTKIPATKPTLPATSTISSTTRQALVETTSTPTISTTPIVEIAESTSRPLLGTLSTTTTQITTSTAKVTSVELNPSTNTSSKSVLSTRNTFLLESTTGKLNLIITPVTSTLANEVLKTNTTITTPKLLNASTKITTTVSMLPTTVTTDNGFSTKTTKSNKENTTDKRKLIDTTTEMYKLNIVYNNVTLTSLKTTEALKPLTQTTQILTANSIYNRTEPPQETRKYVKEVHVEIKTTPIKILKSNEISSTSVTHKTTAINILTEPTMMTTAHVTTLSGEHAKVETTRRPDATIRYFPTTVKFKPKEIWIRPAQKGELFADTKKINHDLHLKHRVAINKEPSSSTTPKTIIVSIIPTSVSYATFKKIALTTASLSSQPINKTQASKNKSEQGFTNPMSALTTASSPEMTNLNTTFATESTTISSISSKTSVDSSKSNLNFKKVVNTVSTLNNAGTTWKKKNISMNRTNSMTTVFQNLNSNSITTTVSSTNFLPTTHTPSTMGISTMITNSTRHMERITKHPIKKVIAKPRNVTHITESGKSNDTVKISKTVVKGVEKTNATKTKDISNTKTNIVTTESPDDEETFHILTEPEHITAVMEGKGNERTSVDLISVISIAGGIMMAVITVAVIIVMIERCRRPRYEDVRKINDIHMQVMIDNNDVPPPYVRSIFHTPLPDPPTSEKCHYQPLSTLDRNLKQFMRPVVVQTISPIMLENFRGILECHYDHLPRRSHDFEVRQKHCSISPSINNVGELAHLRPCSIAESTIDALKCEASLDVLDSSTSEPLYAEIPCWRPPSEHAIEIINMNGEAVTEL